MQKMARPHKPWFRKQTQQWYVEIDGTQHCLGPDKDEAIRRFHKLMATKPKPPPGHIAVILDSFLGWTQAHRSPRTYKWYKDLLQAFVTRYPTLRLRDAKPRHLEDWANEGKGKRAKITAVKRAMNWAVKRGDIPVNPFAAVKRPEVPRRDRLITPEDFTVLLANVKDQCFRDLLEFSWETGCRPHEAKILEPTHVDLENAVCVICKKHAKGKKRPRVIYLTDKAIEILKRNMSKDGVIFRNRNGRAWTANAVRCRFKRLEKKVGTRYCQYLLRHAWTTRKLVAGVDPHIVAALAGHRDARMIDLHYSRASHQHKFLVEQSRKDADERLVREEVAVADLPACRVKFIRPPPARTPS